MKMDEQDFISKNYFEAEILLLHWLAVSCLEFITSQQT